MPKEMLINVSQGEECRIALLEDGHLQELYMERTSASSHVGNIYKGRVTNVEPSIQAAFVDFGLGRNGFLHISDLMPTYFGHRGEDIQETVGRKMSRRDRPPIQRCLRRGDELIVQIIKEGIGSKGPTLTTYLSIPGKILVMMPGMGKMGVSKKIEDDQERRRLRQILDGLKPPKDVAFIIRTAGIGKTKLEIERDLKYLTRLWELLVKREQEPGPVELYTEGDLVTRTVRDLFSPDVERVIVDNEEVAKHVKEVIKISSPRGRNRVDFYDEPVPLFHQFGIEHEIELMHSRHVPLPSGGSLVIDSTEAVVAIDVNSGKFRDHNDAEMTAFKTDMEAADEIPRQLKLRDLGGVIICDFIDLRFERHRRELEERLFENFKNDRAKTKVLRMSQFGIIEITRQRMRPSLKRSIYFDCPHCKGAGLIKTPESLNLDVMRKLAIALNNEKVVRADLAVSGDIAFYLLNRKRAELTELEHRFNKRINITANATLALDELKFELFDARDGAVILEEIGMTLPERITTSGRPPGRGGRSDKRGGRGGQGGSGGPGGRRQDSRPLPTRPVEDDLEEIDDRLAADEGDDDREPLMDREEDPTDIPAILETEAGDEVAEELADEEMGEGQGDDADQPRENQRGHQPGQRDNQSNQRDHRPNQQTHRPNHRGGQQNQRDVQSRGGQPNPRNNQPVQRDNQPNPRGGPQQNHPPGQFANEEGPGGEGGGRRRRRRGRRGRGGQGRQGGDQQQFNPSFNGEPNGNVRPQDDNFNGEPEPFEEPIGDPLNEGQPLDDQNAMEAIGDEPPVRTDSPEPTSDQKPRRRRRRGGRRHRRRNAQGNPIENNQSGEPLSDSARAHDDADEQADETEMDQDSVGEIQTEKQPAIEPDIIPEPEPVAEEVVEETVEEEVIEPVKKPKRASRAKAVPKTAKAASRRIPPKKSATTAAAVEKRADVEEPKGVVRTGSADKHLVRDEPVIPQPLSRPRSYTDLDAIPDDYD